MKLNKTKQKRRPRSSTHFNSLHFNPCTNSLLYLEEPRRLYWVANPKEEGLEVMGYGLGVRDYGLGVRSQGLGLKVEMR